MDGKSIVIIGANASSEALTKQLLKLNFAITLVDSDPALLQYFDEKYDLACINGHPSHADVLALAIESKPHYLIAATNCDETNISCQAISLDTYHMLYKNTAYLDQNHTIPNIDIDCIV